MTQQDATLGSIHSDPSGDDLHWLVWERGELLVYSPSSDFFVTPADWLRKETINGGRFFYGPELWGQLHRFCVDLVIPLEERRL